MFKLRVLIALTLLAVASVEANRAHLEQLLAGHYDEPLLQQLQQKLQREQQEQPAVRIIDGNDVQGVDNAPYLVSLSLTAKTYAHQCAGAIIGKRWVLTCAHCVEELRKFNGDIKGSAIYAGLMNRSNVKEAQVRYVDFASTHRLFNGAAGSDNIALLHVSESFVYSARVQQIALPDLLEDYSGKTAIAYGWGLTHADDAEYSKELQYAFAPLLNSSDCQQLLPKDAPLSRQQVCAQVTACYGDGGTPLVYWPIHGPAELVALGSWSYMPCGYAHRPTVYTSVPAYVDWIYQVISAYYQLN
ncbi:chymotrypsinogen A [Drosophila busckii]|uniref:chymotrypsinogen A n=1 Tax=Drosophila busckii TaxID=30019 RepID=UPI00083F2C53|nr:chymotrypsinogen A [Drosophila busckii]